MICVSIPPPAQEEGFGRLFVVGFFTIDLPRVVGFFTIELPRVVGFFIVSEKFIVVRSIVTELPMFHTIQDRTIWRISTDNPAMKLFNLIFDLIVI